MSGGPCKEEECAKQVAFFAWSILEFSEMISKKEFSLHGQERSDFINHLKDAEEALRLAKEICLK